MNQAASLSFYTLISIIPLFLLVTVILSQFISKTFMLERLMSLLEDLPYQSELLIHNIKALVLRKKAISWLGIGTLFFSSQILYTNFGRIVNRLLHTSKQRHFLAQRALFLFWLLGVIFVLVAPLIFEILFSKMTLLGFNPRVSNQFFVRGGFVLVGFVVFWLVMLLLPTNRVNYKRLFLGSVGFALTLQLGKVVFKWITFQNLDRYNLIYGSLSSVVLVTLWIFYFYNMFLFFVYWVGRDRDPVYHDLYERR